MSNNKVPAEDAEIISKEVHHRIIRKFPRRIILANYKDEIWGTDLCQMDNPDKNYKYILTVIDVYTRFAWGLPLENKRGETIKEAFSEIFSTWNRSPKFIFCDKGTEFYNSVFKAFLAEHDIKIYSTQSELKCSICERLNKTLKHKMERIITANKLQKLPSSWSEILIDIVYEYNYEDVHSFLGMTPAEACKKKNEKKLKELWLDKFNDSIPGDISRAKFKPGQYVRIYKWKSLFEKGFKSNFTSEVFRIKRILPTNPITYVIEDKNKEEILGSFYENEMVKTAFKF